MDPQTGIRAPLVATDRAFSRDRVVRESGKMAESVLTDRECVVLQMLAEGRSSKEIALALEVSSKTIDACRRQIMRKLGVDSIAGLVKQALLLGLTTLQT